MKLTADLIESFAGIFLSPRYDTPLPTPDFHRECWTRYCVDHPACATAAPRNHAKSTALTHDFILANVCFRTEEYVILVGSSEEMAIEHLGDIANELRDNEDLVREFKIRSFIQDQKTDIIVECTDGHQFRILARGAEQKIRGRKWRGKRPGLIVCDDLEDDEQVENSDRRRKFRKWFFRACKQALRDGGRIRVHGTILHEDSLLMNLIKSKQWNSRLYKAHAGFDDFSEMLWAEKFPESRLRAIRQEFIDLFDSPGYSQEYLNDPLDYADKYLQKPWFIGMTEEDHNRFKQLYAGVDFAVSKTDSANRTSFTIGGVCTENLLHFVDQTVGKMDSKEIIDQFFLIYSTRPQIASFFVEDGVIWKAIKPILDAEMRHRNVYIPYFAILPVKDKAVRGRSLQKRMRAGGCRFDKDAEWYPAFEDELLRFTGTSDAMKDDQFDSAAILARGVELQSEVEDSDQLNDDDLEFLRQSNQLRGDGGGRSQVTGY